MEAGVYKQYKVPLIYQILWGKISSCEEGQGIYGLLGRISRGIKGKGK